MRLKKKYYCVKCGNIIFNKMAHALYCKDCTDKLKKYYRSNKYYMRCKKNVRNKK